MEDLYLEFIIIFLYVLLIFLLYIYDRISHDDDDDDDDGKSPEYRKPPSFSHIIGFFLAKWHIVDLKIIGFFLELLAFLRRQYIRCFV